MKNTKPNKNSEIVTNNIRELVYSACFSNRCNTLVVVGEMNKDLICSYRNKEDNAPNFNRLLSCWYITKEELDRISDDELAIMFYIQKDLKSAKITMHSKKLFRKYAHIFKARCANDYYFTYDDLENVRENDKQNRGDLSEIFVGYKVLDKTRDNKYKQDIIIKINYGEKRIERYAQCKFFGDSTPSFNFPIDKTILE